jgi:hypothetical protein
MNFYTTYNQTNFSLQRAKSGILATEMSFGYRASVDSTCTGFGYRASVDSTCTCFGYRTSVDSTCTGFWSWKG